MTIGCSDKAKYDRNKIFYYNESAGISTLDPAFAKDQAIIWATNQLYNGLLQLDSNLNIKPCIASSYQIYPDGKTYIFHLRTDVYFHKNKCFKNSTRKVVARDFVYSFNRIVDSKTASSGIWIMEHIARKSIHNPNDKASLCVFADNDSTLRVVLKEPFAPFLGLMTMPYTFVVPHEAVEMYGEDFRKHPVGTGAFEFKYWKEGVKLVLTKNPLYFEKDTNGQRLPYLDAVDISFIVDKQSVFLEFIKGNIDFLSGIDPSYKDEILTHNGTLQSKYKNKINLYKQPYLNTEYLGFYFDGKDKNNPLLNKYVRMAINYGFDKRKMIKYLRNNIGIAGDYGIVPPILSGQITAQNKIRDNHNIVNKNFNISYHYNPQKAIELLQKAGYYKDKPVVTLSTTSAYLDLCKYIQQQLILLDMNVNLDVVPAAELRERIAGGNADWFRGSWIADYPDAENYLSLFYSKNFTPSGPNYTHFSNKEYDNLYILAIKEKNVQKRKAMYTRMDKIIMDNAPIVVLYYDEVLRFTRKNVHGLHSNAMNLLSLKSVYKYSK